MNVHFDSLSLVGTSLFFFSFSSSFPSTSILSSLSTSGDSTLSSESFWLSRTRFVGGEFSSVDNLGLTPLGGFDVGSADDDSSTDVRAFDISSVGVRFFAAFAAGRLVSSSLSALSSASMVNIRSRRSSDSWNLNKKYLQFAVLFGDEHLSIFANYLNLS